MSNPALSKAIHLCGSQAALAASIGVKQQRVSFWLTRSKCGVPAQYAGAIERATRGVVTRKDIRPDVFTGGEAPPEDLEQRTRRDDDALGYFAALADTATQGVALMEAREGQCRWPFGDPCEESFRFCGAPVVRPASPYCAHHHAIAYRPAPKDFA